MWEQTVDGKRGKMPRKKALGGTQGEVDALDQRVEEIGLGWGYILKLEPPGFIQELSVG